MESTSSGRDFLYGDAAARAFWRAQLVVWSVFAIVGFVSRLAMFGNIEAALWLTLCQESQGFALTSAAAVLYGRRRARRQSPVLVCVCVILLCLGASALLTATGYAVNHLMVPDVIQAIPHQQFKLGFFYYMGMLSIWSLIYFGVSAELAARAERLSKMHAESRALKLELERLQQQIEPHFLFNSLNTIVAEISERPAIAEEMTRRLASYLRYSLDKRGRGLCRLEEEIEAAEIYVRILALRFDTTLECRCRVDPATLNKELPHMTLQGLVENAIKHSMRAEHEHFQVDIDARMQGEDLIIQVSNPGKLQAPFDLTKSGGGLGNLCRRLALRYPDRFKFSLDQRDDKIVAEIRMTGAPKPF
jgi:hypothetical protein